MKDKIEFQLLQKKILKFIPKFILEDFILFLSMLFYYVLFFNSFIYSFIHLFVRLLCFIHSFIYSFINLFIYILYIILNSKQNSICYWCCLYLPISDAESHCTCMCDIFLYLIRYSWSNFPSNAEMSARATESLFPTETRYYK